MQEAKSVKLKSSTKAKKGTPTTAAGQALGYGLQYTRLTAMLLDAPRGAVCSLEVLDDVAQTSAAGATTLVQSKSTLTSNPIADRAVPLWKTLFNWLRIVKAGEVTPDSTIFEIYVSRELEGSIVKAFHAAQTRTHAEQAILQARLELWGAAPKFPEKANLPKELGRFVNPFLEEETLSRCLRHSIESCNVSRQRLRKLQKG